MLCFLFPTECVSDADEKLGELFLEEKLPTNEELKVGCFTVFDNCKLAQMIMMGEFLFVFRGIMSGFNF